MTEFNSVHMSRSITLLICISCALLTNQCKSFKKANLSATPDPIEVHADSIKFNVKASVPPKSGFKRKKGVYTGKVVIQGGNGTAYPMQTLTIVGKNFPDIKKNGASTSAEINQPFDEGMNNGKAVVKGQYARSKKIVNFEDLSVARCCITTSRLICLPPELQGLANNSLNIGATGDADGVAGGSGKDGGKKSSLYIMSTTNYVASQPVLIEAVFEFPQNVFDLQPSELQKEQIKAIGNALKEKNIVEKIEIAGFASPEGTLRRNTFLSIARYKEVQKWLIEQLKAQGYKEEIYLDSTKFAIAHTSEDWDGFKQNLESSSFSPDIQKQILQVLSGAYQPDVKERKVQALVGNYKLPEVESLLAPLRRTTIRLKGKTTMHSEDQIKAILQGFLSGAKNIDSLRTFFGENADEMLFGINMFSSDEDKLKLTAPFAQLFPKDHRALNDRGVYFAKTKDLPKGIESLSNANKLKPNDYMILNNLGMAYLISGNLDTAITFLTQANNIQNNPASQFAIGFIHLKKGRYPEAAEMFDKVGTAIPCAKYNGGLAKLLMDDLPGAKDDLENYSSNLNTKNPYGFYLLSIVGAQGGDVNMMTLNLKKSVQLEKTISPKAEKDLEFREFHTNEEFKAALKP
jgi:tetratricopeptide (TPR) repeat protein